MNVRACIRKILFLILFVAFVCFSPAHTQDSNSPVNQNLHQWGAISLFNGLPSNTVRAIAQTADGVLWFGTDGGLAKFDGRLVEKVSLPDLAAQIIYALAVAPDESLWIGTDKGAIRFSQGEFSAIEATAEQTINSILIREKEVFLGSSDKIFKIETGAENALRASEILDQDLKINVLASGKDGLLIGSLGRGLISFSDGTAQEITSRPRPFFINVLTRDAQNNLWFGADTDDRASGLYLANEISRPEIIGGNFGTVTAISGDGANGAVWVGTETNGLFYVRGNQIVKNYTFANTAGGLRSNRIYGVFVDREKTVWIGTDRGISRFDAKSPFNQSFSTDAASNIVRTLYQTRTGKIFAGTNRGLFAFENDVWRGVNEFSEKTVYAVAENPNGEIYVGSVSGLFSLNGKRITTGDVRGIVNFQDKIYAAVIGKGLIEIGEDEKIVLEHETITSISASEKSLLVGTGKGEIFAFDGKQIVRSEQFKDLNGAAIWRIRQDEKSVLFATENGLFIYRSGAVEKYLPSTVVRDAFITDSGEIWAATIGGGLFHIKFDETFGQLTANLSAEQGLPSASIFALLPLSGGEFLIGTTRGASLYAPNELPPQIALKRILSQRLYSEREMRQGIRLDYPQNSLVLEVTGLSSRTFPEQFLYAFLLKDSKGEIIKKKISKEAQFVMDELAAGDYQVEAVAFNQDLTASEPLIFNFSVSDAPFPWTSAALAALLGIALIALVWAIVERRRITDANRQLTHARLDLANEAERERRRIARDLHDQTLADLRNLMLMSDKLPGETSDFRGEVESVSEEIRRICEDLSPSALENVGLVAALEFLLSGMTTNYEFGASENLEERLDLPPNVQIQVFRIAQEVLSNIKRHADAKKIKMRIFDLPENGLTLEIEDDGLSFEAKTAMKKGRGLTNIKSRAALIEAEVAWEKISGGGTLFTLYKQRKNL